MADVIQTLPNTKSDLIVAAVQKNLIEKSVLAPTVRNVSQFAVKGAKAFDVPKLSNFSVTNRAFGVAADASKLTDSSDTVSLNFNAYIAWLFDSRDIYQSSLEYKTEAAIRASLAHAKYVDEQILNTIDLIAEHEVSAAAVVGVKDQVLEMRRLLLKDGGDIDRMTIAIGPDKEAEMLAVVDFIRADFYGSANVRTGQIGMLYGIPVVISRLIAGDNMKMYDADGCGLAFQGGVEMSEQDANEFGANSKRTAMDQVFGVGGLELGEQGAASTKSPLVAKLVA
jgi:hypothetical protein